MDDSFESFHPEEDKDFKESIVEDSQYSQSHSQRPAENDTMVNEIEEQDIQAAKGSDDIIQILVATDIHCGYGENKPNINMDAVNTFEEVLQIATEKQVDMVLLGGDLFHENHPSREVQHRVTQLLRKYCLNGNPISMEFLSDPSVNFNQSIFDRVNYYDENINVGLPVFTIHGNHDDLSGKGLTALDLLHEAGLINLFGKHDNIKEFHISPLLLRKGNTRLALYGLGSQRDDRLVRAFKDNNITFFRPSSGAEDWFNLFVLHQNRPRRAMHRSTGSYLPETLIPNFFDLLIWGHEHECKPDPQYVAASEAVGDGFYILQPGSTVATSLTEEEALQKNVFLIKIKGRNFASKPIPLKTTRPMVVETMVFNKIPAGVKPKDKSNRPVGKDGRYVDEVAIEEKLAEMIEKARRNRGERQPELPLIRLKVLYEDEWSNVQAINAKRMGARYEKIVANPIDMVTTKKKTVRDRKTKSKGTEFDDERLGNVSASNLQYIVNDYFAKLPLREKMTVLKPADIGKALEHYSNLDDKSSTVAKANQEFVTSLTDQMDLMRKKLCELPVPSLESEKDFDTFAELIGKDVMCLKQKYYEKIGEVGNAEEAATTASDDDVMQFYSQSQNIPSESSIRNSVRFDDDDDNVTVLSSDEEPEVGPPAKKTASRGRGRGRGAAAASSRGTTTKRKKDASFL